MKKLALLTLTIPALAAAQTPEPAAIPQSPTEIVAATTADDWRPIAAENLLAMTLGGGEQVFIELAPDFAPVHVENIRTLARAHWWDGTSINRVQDNYVVQWGDATEEKPLPEGIVAQPPAEYEMYQTDAQENVIIFRHPKNQLEDAYALWATFIDGWPIAVEVSNDTRTETRWLTHCYGMVGVGRGDNPDTGTGAELYTVIGHAPRHLDRNIALVGRVVEGIAALSSLPRGTGDLGFYEDEAQRVPIASIRLASEMPESERPRFEVMRTDTDTFRNYVNARANRSGWFIRPAGAVDVCNVNLPIRRVGE